MRGMYLVVDILLHQDNTMLHILLAFWPLEFTLYLMILGLLINYLVTFTIFLRVRRWTRKSQSQLPNMTTVRPERSSVVFDFFKSFILDTLVWVVWKWAWDRKLSNGMSLAWIWPLDYKIQVVKVVRFNSRCKSKKGGQFRSIGRLVGRLRDWQVKIPLVWRSQN